ncbi:hypothetical protein NHX12_027982 [Muraenolepis orangiensis]|uniref:Uncharacterized protein n=1 Tax=Muraenolepis orangiensis TaxID=630683 RepID=A0A9Q0EFQ8_9TELE|nr:hypothetical protein NHX12_027982 [Muraenolepis orangiensis]
MCGKVWFSTASKGAVERRLVTRYDLTAPLGTEHFSGEPFPGLRLEEAFRVESIGLRSGTRRVRRTAQHHLHCPVTVWQVFRSHPSPSHLTATSDRLLTCPLIQRHPDCMAKPCKPRWC